MKIDNVIIASDNHPMYLELYPSVAKAWCAMGIEPIMLHICDEDTELEKVDYGFYKKIKKIEGVKTGTQAQVVRLYAMELFPEKNLLISDIDMMPINKDYFVKTAEPIAEDEILIYTGQPYGNVPFYPMCYILGKGRVIANAVRIEDMCFEEYCKHLDKKYSGAWNTDENFFYERINEWEDFEEKVVILNGRDLDRRINRTNWEYDVNELKNGYYIDSHLLRPYRTYKKEIDKLLDEVLFTLSPS